MQQEAQLIRQMVLDWQRPGPTTPYPPKIRRRVIDFARRARAAGAAWDAIHRAIGIHETTIRKWIKANQHPQQDTPKSMVPVSVLSAEVAPSEALVLVSPGGFRLEGLSLAEAVHALAALP